jgi:hypothetical protein
VLASWYDLNKLQARRNRWGGILSGCASLPISRAWEFFGPDNGCADLAEMRTRIGRYRGQHDGGRLDLEIGCITSISKRTPR